MVMKERFTMLVPNPQFFDKDERLNKNCPKCGSSKVSYLLHSIFYDDGDEQLVKSGEIIQMGCMYHEPFNLGCMDCEHIWASTPMVIEDENSIAQ
jgi:hypothetical protein